MVPFPKDSDHIAGVMKKIAIIVAVLAVILPQAAVAVEGALYMSPAGGTYEIGQEFEVEVMADTDGERAGAAEADISFNPAALMVTGISTERSILTLWPTPPEYSNTKGTIRFSGTAGTSYKGKEGLLVTIRFIALGNLPGDVRIDSGAILASDARATNIITSMRSSLYTIVARRADSVPTATPVATTSEPVPEVAGASIVVPSIAGYDDRVSIGERIVLQGTAAPDSRVSIILQFESDTPKESTVLTTRDGSFTYVASEPAEEGMYRAWAEVRTGAETFTSDKIMISASNVGFLAAASAAAPILTLALPYLLLVIAAGCSLGFLYNRRAARKQ